MDEQISQLQREFENIQREIGAESSSTTAFVRNGGALARVLFFYWSSLLFFLIIVGVLHPPVIFVDRVEKTREGSSVVLTTRRFSFTRYLLTCTGLWALFVALFWVHTALLNPKKAGVGHKHI